MPSDFDAMKAFFNLMKIEYELKESGGVIDPDGGCIVKSGKGEPFPYGKMLRLKEGCGNSGFTCDFYFDEKGKFIKHGVWE